MAAGASYEFHDLRPAAASFLEDVVAGLSAPQKALPPKYFYDARGSQLFEAICATPEYYPTRTELAMLERCAPEMARRIGPDALVIEYGSGSGRKTALLIEAARPRGYAAIDISAAQLRQAIEALAAAYPQVRMLAICADYTRTPLIPQLEHFEASRRIIYFPGSTIGNFSVAEALDFLRTARAVAGARGAMLVGVDLEKDHAILNAAYNDAQGVTAAFNLNVLVRINRELGADFDLGAWAHRACYVPELHRIEMHLVAKRDQIVSVGDHRFAFAGGETIHTENSYKYSVESFRSLAHEAGFVPEHCWVDPQQLFSVHYLTVGS